MTFALCLALVLAVQTEPTNQRMAPRAIALEIARVARTPLEAAVMAVTSWEESRHVPDAVGDSGRALCAFQLQHAPSSVLRDLRQCVEVAHARLVASAEACPDAPLALYASGRCDRGTKLSRRRMTQAASALALVRPE